MLPRVPQSHEGAKDHTIGHQSTKAKCLDIMQGHPLWVNKSKNSFNRKNTNKININCKNRLWTIFFYKVSIHFLYNLSVLWYKQPFWSWTILPINILRGQFYIVVKQWSTSQVQAGNDNSHYTFIMHKLVIIKRGVLESKLSSII